MSRTTRLAITVATVLLFGCSLAGCSSHPTAQRLPSLPVQCAEAVSPVVNTAASPVGSSGSALSLPAGSDLLLTTTGNPQPLPSHAALCLARPPTPTLQGRCCSRTYVYRARTPGFTLLEVDKGETGQGIPVTVLATTGSPPQPPPPVTEVSIADNAHTVRLSVGQDLRIELQSDFDPVGVSKPGIAEVVASAGGYDTGASLSTVLVALRPGTTEIGSSTDAPCLHRTPSCSIPQFAFGITVTVG